MLSHPRFNVSSPPARAGEVDFISGRTRLYGIVGHPIAQARSPQALTHELRRRGEDAVLVPIDIRPEDFDEVFPRLLRLDNLDGLVITVPHKPNVLPWLDHVGPTARLCGAASVLARARPGGWMGEAHDGMGCIDAIERRGVPVAGLSAQLMGAGGAGAAIAFELARRGVGRLRIVDPDRRKAERLLEALLGGFPALAARAVVGSPALDDIDLLINASPVGMLDPQAAPIADIRIPARVVVMDAVMDPERTRLISIAEDSGCVTVRGREMLDAQIASACDFLLAARGGVAAAIAAWPREEAPV
ncbi:shikimate dehydrogenase family protein [Acidovorax facilis]|jgi:shikimate dehydrogenase|uniref:shikimate dehydrogenase family protein n=1 Tax=Acidovorax facilis TaxID=12917 RepID=UPI003D647F82